MHAPCDAHDVLACPVDGAPLSVQDGWLVGNCGHRYPVVEGVPVLLRDDVEHTIGIAARSLDLAQRWMAGDRSDRMFVDTLGITDDERTSVRRALADPGSVVDPVVSRLVAATNGILYKGLAGNLSRTPIPDTRLPEGGGRRLLDVGCSWGRWSVAAATRGWRPVGIDPSLGAVLAARRLAASRRQPFEGVVGDARHLPFRPASLDAAFSYSVLQHFSKPDAQHAFGQLARAIKPGGLIRIQMASATGMRSLQHIAMRRFAEPANFDVRYWFPSALLREFKRAFGNSKLEVDCYFGLGLQPTDYQLYGQAGRILLTVSERLRKASRVLPPLRYCADSVYLIGTNEARIPGSFSQR